MKPTKLIVIVLGFVVLVGCTGTIPLSRKHDYFGVKKYIGSESTGFTGKLNLIYEKNLRGSVTGPILIDGQYLGFNTSRQRFLLYDKDRAKKLARFKKRYGLVFGPILDDSLLILVNKAPYGRLEIYNLYKASAIYEREVKEISSDPIIAVDKLVLGTSDGIMTFTLPELESVGEVSGEGMVDIEPYFDDGVIFYVAGKNSLVARNLDTDKVLWQKDLDADIISLTGPGSYLYLSLADDRLVAIDRDKGQIVWTAYFDFPIRGQVLQDRDMIYLGGTDRNIYGLNYADGHRVWSYETEGIVTARPVIWGKAVIVGSQDRRLYSLDAKTGEVLDVWQLQGGVTEAAVVSGRRLYVADRKHRIYCFEGQYEANSESGREKP